MPVFFDPWFLMAGATAAFPILIHLLHRRKPTPVPFSTLRFLRDALAKTRRSRHVTHFLTLLMRVLILLLLAMAFSRPKIRIASWLPESRRHVVIVLDCSASMQCQKSETTSFEAARQWALSLLGSLREGDRAALLLPGAPVPRMVFPAVSKHESIRASLEDARAEWGRADLTAVLRELLVAIPPGAESDGAEIHVFSDFQVSGWDEAVGEELAPELAERRIALFVNDVSAEMPVNAGIQEALFQPPAIFGDGEFQATVSIRGSEGFDGMNSLRLLVGDDEASRTSFQISGLDGIEHSLVGTVSGEDEIAKGTLELGDDALAADNSFRFVLPRIAGVPVLVVDGGADGPESSADTFFVAFALQPRGRSRSVFVPQVADWAMFSSQDLTPFRAVYICNPPALDDSVALRLEEFASAGGTVVILPGEHGGVEEGLGLVKPLEGIEAEKEVFAQEQSIKVLGSSHPTALEKRVLRTLPKVPPIVTRRRLRFAGVPTAAEAVFKFADGRPFLLRTPVGTGAIWVGSLGGGRDWSDWPLTPLFVVLQHEIVSSGVRDRLRPLIVQVGGAFPVLPSHTELEADVQLISPQGDVKAVVSRRETPGEPFMVSGFTSPGFWQIRHGDVELRVAVNIPKEESDLRFLEHMTLATNLGGTAVYFARNWSEHRERVSTLSQGRPLWPFLLVVAFLLALAEELFANLQSWVTEMPALVQQFLRRRAQPV